MQSSLLRENAELANNDMEENCDRHGRYGPPGLRREWTLVSNPARISLPPLQHELEATSRDPLKSRYDIVFWERHTITILPIRRFLDDLLRADQLDVCMQKLIDVFHSLTVEGVMCGSGQTGWHCFGCTDGCGLGCQGTVVKIASKESS
ncbi:DUF3641 domain-containing protein [Rhodopirellula sp. P2]|uniref:DUF3641 domain-containing protein n=1 Tax=Rhodopirellula sp. P2 TaxID=2127060 RepID=UPI002368DC14|nr:DUF3641 domain-containing protein [Rhodopirellula sp. P2]WDQ17101.1 DUF3641 domain-containing protein [Rhodopirellula sp. P2]